MNAVLRSLHHRIFSTAPAVIPLVDTWLSYSTDRNIWRLLTILGWGVLASAWFLRPVVLARSLQESNSRSAQLAIITQQQFGVILGVGLAIVALSLVARHTGAA